MMPPNNDEKTEQIEDIICSECGEDVTPEDDCCPKCGADFRDEDEEDLLISTQHKSPSKSNHINITACKVYLENAFRILGVAGNSTLRKVREAQQELAIRARAGGLTNAGDLLTCLGKVERNENTIRDAFNRLKDPKMRLQERLFWFSNNTTADEEALANLAAEDMQGAILRWTTDKSITSTANLARIHHINCIVKDPEALHPHIWEPTLAKWAATLKSNDLWEQFNEFELDARFEPTATSADFEQLREQSWIFVLQPTVMLIQANIKRGKIDVAQRHFNMMQNSDFPARILFQLEGDLLEPLEVQVEERANNILYNLTNMLKGSELSYVSKKEACDKAYQDFKAVALHQIEQMEQLAGVKSESVKRARKIGASCLREISICYHNDADDNQASERLLKESQAFTADTILAEKITEDLKTVSKHIQQEKIWKNLKPIKAAPSLSTFNGIGSKLYGLTDYDSESNSYLSTLYFVVLFIPIFPLARYRVIESGDNSYRFLGKAPLRNIDKWHTAIAISVILLSFLFLCLSSILTSNTNTYTAPTSPRTVVESTPNAQRFKNNDNDRIKTLNYQITENKKAISVYETEMKQLKSNIASYESTIYTYGSQIKQMKDDIKAGYSVDMEEYEKKITQHNYYVDLYDNDLNRYNAKYYKYDKLFKETNALIEEYNKAIRGH